MSFEVERHRTAIRRSEPSRPIRLAVNDGIITSESVVFDYGCGHGDDMRHLGRMGIRSFGWDPAHSPLSDKKPADIVNLGYVVNVIERAAERVQVLREAWALTQKVLVVAARLTLENREDRTVPCEDGFLTRLGTFQKFYEQHELREWIDAVLEVQCVAAAPGVFYVFKDDQLRSSFVASRYRRRTYAPRQRHSDVLFEQHKELLQPLMDFVALRGRIPDPFELDSAGYIVTALGSIRRAFALIKKVTGDEHWDKIREERSQDLLVYLALARFDKRPRFSQLPQEMQLDVRGFFSTYANACDIADDLLFSAGETETISQACRKSPVGKLTPTSLYIHASARPHLTPVLRVYEGCARALVGDVEGANLIKMHHDEPKVSYLSYPDFDKDPHPALLGSLRVHLQTFRIRYREFKDWKNPPILHRKEKFVAADYPLRGKFARLTEQEERWNLYDSPETIGMRNGWNAKLAERGARLAGHRVVRKAQVADATSESCSE